jgi:heme/copper-type cytochrome/quinol oxidase subunit 3
MKLLDIRALRRSTLDPVSSHWRDARATFDAAMTTPTTPARADPMPVAALGMWLFIAGEAMFFAGLLSAFLVLQSTAGERALFVRSAAMVSRPATIGAAALLLTMSAALWRGVTRIGPQVVAAGLAVAFLGVQAWAGDRLLAHETIVTTSAVYDGGAAHGRGMVVVTGTRMPLPAAFDVARTVGSDLRGGTAIDREPIDPTDIRLEADYGPSRNNYFACYFLVTAAHALHVGGGLVALAWLAVRTRRGTATRLQAHVVCLYWQFVNGVGLLAILLLWLG